MAQRKPGSAKSAKDKADARAAGETPDDQMSGGKTPEYVLDGQIGFVLRKAHQRASDIFNETMSTFDVTPTQFAALAKLREVGETSQNRLGRMTSMDPATILGVITRLKKRGFIAQRVDPADARLILLSLSESGRLHIDDMQRAALSVSAKTLSPLSQAQARQLLDLLARIG